MPMHAGKQVKVEKIDIHPTKRMTSFTKTLPEVIKFNIGGQRYEVSLYLLQQHPNSILTKSVSEQFQSDHLDISKAETFIERDGTMFRFILAYLRDGKVTLPITESKEAFMMELAYYGIEIHEEHIDEKHVHMTKSTHSMKTAVEDLRESITILEKESDRVRKNILCVELAIDFITIYLNEILTENWNKGWNDLGEKLNNHRSALSHLEQLKVLADDDVVQRGVNSHLNTVGLHLVEYETDRGKYRKNERKLKFGVHCKGAKLALIDSVTSHSSSESVWGQKRARYV